MALGVNTDAGHVSEIDQLGVTMSHALTLSSSAPDVRQVQSQSIDCRVGQVGEMSTEQPLIQLNSTFESERGVIESPGFGALNTMSLASKSVTLPRNATLSGAQTMWSANNDAHEDSFGEFVSSSTSSSCTPIPECTTVTPSTGEQHASTPTTRSGPVPRPRSSLRRSTAFHGGPTPSIAVRKSSSASSLRTTDCQTLKDARSAFMESDGSKHSLHSLNHLEQFDPLLTGQLAIDSTSVSSLGTGSGASSGRGVKQEENLLREWNLDFSRMSPALNGGRDKAPPDVAPKPPPRTHHLVNHPPVGYGPPVLPRMVCGTLPAQFKGQSQVSYMPPRQPQHPPPRANYAPLWRGRQRHGVQSLISTFEKTSTPRNIPGQHQFATHTPGAAPALDTRGTVNQSVDLLQDPFGDIMNVTANTSTSPSRSPRATWTTFD